MIPLQPTTMLVANAGYAELGILFAIWFVLHGAGRIDPVAHSGSLGFRLVGLPGSAAAHPMTLLIRATNSRAFVMLSIILMIGPAARLSPRFSPLLYNRRHFGVITFLLALIHGAPAIFWYHGFGIVNPIVSVLPASESSVQEPGDGMVPIDAIRLLEDMTDG